MVGTEGANAFGGGNSVVVYQETDASADHYLANRRALVGPGCTVNSLFDGVQLVAGVSQLDCLCNDSLDDYSVFPGLANVTVGGSPIVSVKDHRYHYAAGTEAGFAICAKSDAKLLGLDLVKFYKIQFLCDGKPVGDLQSITAGQDITGLGLSLIQVPGSDMVTKSLVATAPAEFDEIKLYQMGVDAAVLTSIDIKYAFVGRAHEYTLTNSATNGMAAYAKDQGRGTITLEARGASPTDLVKNSLTAKVIDDDLANGYTVGVLLSVGAELPITVVARSADGEETFPAGTEVGFKYNSPSLLNLGLATGADLHFYDRNNKELHTYNISTTVLRLGLVTDNNDAEFMMKAPEAFTSVKLVLYGVKVNLGADVVNYAFVRMAPDRASHHCAIEATSDRDVCGCDNELYLQHNPSFDVTWAVTSEPAGSHVQIDQATGRVTDIYVPGDYTFTATAADGCTEVSTIHYAPESYDPAAHGETLLVNPEGSVRYALSDRLGAGLLQVADDVKARSALLTSALTDFAYRTPGVALAANSCIAGIRSADGTNLAAGMTDAMNVGFVVSSKTSGLDASVLKLYNIQLYKNGQKVMGGATTHWDAISAGLIGKEDTHRMRLSISVPKGTDFDEVVLYNSGVLSADLSQLNIYYAYVSDATQDNAANNELFEADPISVDATNASIDLANTKMFSVANIGNGYNQLGNLIDGDFTTAVTFPLGVDLGGATIAVNIGKTVNPGQQLVLVTNTMALGLGVSLGEGLQVTTYLDGTEAETLTNWKVLGADVIGTGGKGYAVLNPTKPFDQVRIKQVKVVSALSNLQVYGMALRSDMDQDGTPDVVSNGCVDDLVLDEDRTLDETQTLDGAKLVLRRTLSTGKWNSVILPVSMNLAQFRAAFGDEAEAAVYDHVADGWIYYATFTDEADGIFLQKNTPYLIKPTKEPLANSEVTIGSITSVLEGPIYMTTGIDYTDETATLAHAVSDAAGTLTFRGSYARPTQVPAGSYMLNGGTMVHTATAHAVKAYRCWLEPADPSAAQLQMRVEGTPGATDGIAVIEETPSGHTPIYTVSGIRMEGYTLATLPKGVYIVSNKKYIVK